MTSRVAAASVTCIHDWPVDWVDQTYSTEVTCRRCGLIRGVDVHGDFMYTSVIDVPASAEPAPTPTMPELLLRYDVDTDNFGQDIVLTCDLHPDMILKSEVTTNLLQLLHAAQKHEKEYH